MDQASEREEQILSLSLTGFDRKACYIAILVFSANSAYLCVLCVKYSGANHLTQSTQRYAEHTEKS
jgi:hypothetical protein